MVESRDLFGRVATIRVDTIGVVNRVLNQGVRVVFNVNKSLKIEPNKTRVDIYNLSPKSRNQLSTLDAVNVEVLAGYEANGLEAQVFNGTLRKVSTKRDGPDIITTIEAGDGEKTHQSARVNRSFPAGTKVSDILSSLVKDLTGIGPGNALDQEAIAFISGGNTIQEAITINGNASRELVRMVKAFGFEASYQGEALQVLKRGAVLNQSAVFLSAKSGMLDSPTIDNKGVMKVRALIQPGFDPGQLLVVNGEYLQGNFRIEKVTYKGDTYGEDWYAEIEGSKF